MAAMVSTSSGWICAKASRILDPHENSVRRLDELRSPAVSDSHFDDQVIGVGCIRAPSRASFPPREPSRSRRESQQLDDDPQGPDLVMSSSPGSSFWRFSGHEENLVFPVSCRLQRVDGFLPAHEEGTII